MFQLYQGVSVRTQTREDIDAKHGTLIAAVYIKSGGVILKFEQDQHETSYS